MDSVRPKILAGREHPAYKHPQHAQKGFEILNQMRKSGLLCDVTLKVGGVELAAHKNVLASCSQYFYAMFTGDLAESKADCITLKDIDPKALATLIEFTYTSEIQVTEENVQTLLPAANIVQITEVREACCEFLQSQLHPSNCLGICHFADIHACTELLSFSQTYIEQHFTEVVHYDEFLSLSAERVARLISSDRVTVTNEEQVYEAVMSWVNHDLQNRENKLESLLEHVRLPLMSQDYIVQKVEEEPLIKGNSRCKDFLIEAMKYHLLKLEQKAMYKTPRTQPRNPIGLPKVLLVVGGQAPKAIRSVECFDFVENKWIQLAEMPSRRCRCDSMYTMSSPVFHPLSVDFPMMMDSPEGRPDPFRPLPVIHWGSQTAGQLEQQRAALAEKYGEWHIYMLVYPLMLVDYEEVSIPHCIGWAAVVREENPDGSGQRWWVDTVVSQGVLETSPLVNPTMDCIAVKPIKVSTNTCLVMNLQTFQLELPPFMVLSSSPANLHMYWVCIAFQARASHQLSVKRLETVVVKSFEDDSGDTEWWLVKCRFINKLGYVPRFCLRRIWN